MNDHSRQWKPHVTVATVVVRTDGRYLLVEEMADGERVFNQPAGHLERDESLVEAAHRETLEETGWEITIEAVIGASLYTNPRNGITYFRTNFLASPLRHHPDRPLDQEIIAPHWLSYEDVLARRDCLRGGSVLATIEQHRAGRRFPLDFFFPVVR